jgi:NADPH-dependent 2,4-dienoyl-CoA reductase/sulfur reductase-like enzyme/rhodanese-related sulfurtransferase
MNQSQPLRILIVGGVAGGASAAARARRVDPTAEITILERGPAVSFANCGLPYHVGGEIEQRGKLLVATPELFWNRFRISVKTHHEVRSIDRVARSVLVRATNAEGQSSEITLPYDRLILSTGAEPFRPEFADPMPENAFHLWTLPDMDRVLDYLNRNPVKRVLVIGGGFVGMEVVEQFHRRGLHVDLVERNPQILTRLDPIFAQMVTEHTKSKGVRVMTGDSVVSLTRVGNTATHAQLSSGESLATDLILIGAGVRPRIQLAAGAGLDIGPAGGVTVNPWMQTSDPLVYAVGDIVEYTHGVTQKRGLNPLAGPANRSGRIAGEHAVRGTAQPMGPVLGTSIVRVFDLTAASTGLNERELGRAAISFRTAIIQAAHHATYFPGAVSMQLKVLYSETDGRLLGAQAVGGEGVDKRIDIIATAMAMSGTVYDLAKLDLAYAPPFGSAKDPIHMAAFAAINDLEHSPRLLPPDAKLVGLQIVDVRTDKERQQLPLGDAIPIGIDELPTRWSELDPQRPTVVVCHSGKRAHVGACRLRASGFTEVYNLTGGMSVRSMVPKSPAT